MSDKRILVVDDEVELAQIVRDYLKTEGFTVELAHNGKSALTSLEYFKPQLILLDIMLPDYDGLEICRKIRSNSNIPIILLSAKNTDIDKILGLGIGADDYISKPFSPSELVARVKAHLRRFVYLSSGINPVRKENLGDFIIDDKTYTVKVRNKAIELTAKEFELLRFLASYPMQVFTKEQLFNQVWGFDEYGDINTVTVHIRKIREKVEEKPSQPTYIKTVWGIGYKFDGGLDESLFK